MALLSAKASKSKGKAAMYSAYAGATKSATDGVNSMGSGGTGLGTKSYST